MIKEHAKYPFGICAFGLAYACGIVWTGTEHANPQPLDGLRLLDLAAEHELAFVELPGTLLPGVDDASLAAFRTRADELGLGIVVAGGLIEEEGLRRDLQLAHQLGASTVRCIMSRVLCGDRRGFPGGWYPHFERCSDTLGALLPEAERLGVTIAVENHQDLDSADLLTLCGRFESPHLGITLDTGNPLAVLEEPVAFAARIGKYLRHVHLKDYLVYPAPNGVRLVRSAAGEGAVDFPGLLRLCADLPQPITLSLEQGALQARQIPYLEPTWHEEFRPRPEGFNDPALHTLQTHLRPESEDWQTPYERGDNPHALAAYEWQEFHASVNYFQALWDEESKVQSPRVQ